MMEHGMFMRVLAVVLASGLWGGLTARAEEKKAPPAAKSGKLVGILTAKTDTEITVKPEGKAEEQHYLLAAPGGAPSATVQAAAKTLFIPNLVSLQWQLQDDQPVVTSIHAIMPKVRTGMVLGTIVARESTDKSVSIDVKPAGGQGYTERYFPCWVLNQRGFDKEMIQTIGTLNVGDKVKLTWVCDERKRAAKLQVLSRAPAPKPTEKEKE